jgi:hypothetical protein
MSSSSFVDARIESKQCFVCSIVQAISSQTTLDCVGIYVHLTRKPAAYEWNYSNIM